jgi:hypothetical protein
MQNAIQAAGDAGILFVAAAGNSASNNDVKPQYPANYTASNVISVAASDQNDRLAYFSCYGATTVDLAAPGVSIYSTLPGNRYGAYSGTSMATPHVAAVAALAWAANPNASVADVRNAIFQGVDHLTAFSGKMVTGGRLNAYHTLQIITSASSQQPQSPTPPPVKKILASGSTVGLYSVGTSSFALKNVGAGNSTTFNYSPTDGNWVALAGDWNGDGVDTIGLYDKTTSRFYLKNSNDGGTADISFAYGPAGSGWTPIVGDWNADGIDTIGLYDPTRSMFYLRNSNSDGYANLAVAYGPANSGWTPIVGDWNADGKDTIGLYDPTRSIFYLRNTNNSGVANVAFAYGSAGSGWTPIVGDWNGDGKDTVGLYDPTQSAFYLRNTNKSGCADAAFVFGSASAGLTPVVGDWDGAAGSSNAIGSGLSAASQSVLTEFHAATPLVIRDWLALSVTADGRNSAVANIARLEAIVDSLMQHNLDQVGAGRHDPRGHGVQPVDPSTVLGNDVGLSAANRPSDKGLPYRTAALRTDLRLDVDALLNEILNQPSFDDLLADSSVERRAVDQSFALLADVE